MAQEENITQSTIRKAVVDIKTAILQGQYEAAKGVNRVQLMVYFAIGKYISFYTRKKNWGTGALDMISSQLRKELPGLRGYSPTQLKQMRLFYEQWIMLDANSSVVTDEFSEVVDSECRGNSSVMTDELKCAQLPVLTEPEQNVSIDIFNTMVISKVGEFPVEDFFAVPFTHHTQILSGAKDLSARYYYIHRTASEHLSARKLTQIIKQNAYEHFGDMPNNFPSTIGDAKEARKAVAMFKDEYLLDFINVEEIEEHEAIDVDERVVEQRIVRNIKKFIMTFGHDFAFIGNQYHLEMCGEEFFPDLLFFNRELNAMVVVELKMGEFKTSYLGQLFGYLQILDDKVRKPHENPSIGIVLCKSANKAYAEYAVRDYTKPMGVSTYKTLDDMPDNLSKALPDVQKMIEILDSSEES